MTGIIDENIFYSLVGSSSEFGSNTKALDFFMVG
jgi:hypothetical protein